jgi:hypothetical protein
MNYRATRTIGGTGNGRIKPGTIVEAGKQLSEAECAAHVKSGFLEAMGETQPGVSPEQKVDVRKPAPKPVRGLAEMNAELKAIDLELVCDTIEEAEAMLAQLARAKEKG